MGTTIFMGSWSSILAIITVTILVEFCFFTSAQTTGSEYLDPHNAARATVGVPPLSWSSDLADYALAYAQTQASQCLPLTHSHGQYGENLFWGSAKDPEWTALDAVTAWTDEVAYYDYATNSCTPGQMCGHYTQVVWNTTTQVGCAHVKCNDDADYIICSYDPPGNWIGELPY
ncbi:hypothetical protein M758_5G016200 [Ceratodon purpureus]|nr:hypothetical protein M758_5G016200 [Ceratodon purpureus]